MAGGRGGAGSDMAGNPANLPWEGHLWHKRACACEAIIVTNC